jgi:hypothetical protein
VSENGEGTERRGTHELGQVLRQLADFEATAWPVLSVYLDMRPWTTGEALAARAAGAVLLVERLQEIEKTFPPRGGALESFRMDAERVQWYLSKVISRSTAGVALFACADADLFAAVEVDVAFGDQVSVGEVPDLFQLIRVLDEPETAVVALVDSRAWRLFVTRVGRLAPVSGANQDDASSSGRSIVRGWSQARYQRRHVAVRGELARETAAAIGRLVAEEDAGRVILAGDGVALPTLQAALSPPVAARVRHVLRLRTQAPGNDAQVENVEIAPLVAVAEADDARTAADRLVAAVQAGELGVVGLEPTWQALRAAQVDELLMDPAAELDDATWSELSRLAVTSRAGVEVVHGHEVFRQLGGVGALLRYRLGRSVSPEPAPAS